MAARTITSKVGWQTGLSLEVRHLGLCIAVLSLLTELGANLLRLPKARRSGDTGVGQRVLFTSARR